MIDHLRLRTRHRLLRRRSVGRLGRNGNGHGEQSRPTKPNRFVLEPGVVHTPAAAPPREGNIRYLKAESIETGKMRVLGGKKTLVTRQRHSPEWPLAPPINGAGR